MRDLNATSAALLGLLHDGPRTGGQLVALASERFGSFFSVTRSQVYRELPVLAEAGLLRLGKKGARSSQQFVITAAPVPTASREKGQRADQSMAARARAVAETTTTATW